jgi:hypothetical protein
MVVLLPPPECEMDVGWQLRKVECALSSMARGVVVVVTFLFGHVGGEERVAGDSGVGAALAKVF